MDTKMFKRKSDADILHAAKAIIQCEMALNNEVDKLLALINLTREEVCRGVEDD